MNVTAVETTMRRARRDMAITVGMWWSAIADDGVGGLQVSSGSGAAHGADTRGRRSVVDTVTDHGQSGTSSLVSCRTAATLSSGSSPACTSSIATCTPSRDRRWPGRR